MVKFNILRQLVFILAPLLVVGEPLLGNTSDVSAMHAMLFMKAFFLILFI